MEDCHRNAPASEEDKEEVGKAEGTEVGKEVGTGSQDPQCLNRS